MCAAPACHTASSGLAAAEAACARRCPPDGLSPEATAGAAAAARWRSVECWQPSVTDISTAATTAAVIHGGYAPGFGGDEGATRTGGARRGRGRRCGVRRRRARRAAGARGPAPAPERARRAHGGAGVCEAHQIARGSADQVAHARHAATDRLSDRPFRFVRGLLQRLRALGLLVPRQLRPERDAAHQGARRRRHLLAYQRANPSDSRRRAWAVLLRRLRGESRRRPASRRAGPPADAIVRHIRARSSCR